MRINIIITYIAHIKALRNSVYYIVKLTKLYVSFSKFIIQSFYVNSILTNNVKLVIVWLNKEAIKMGVVATAGKAYILMCTRNLDIDLVARM